MSFDISNRHSNLLWLRVGFRGNHTSYSLWLSLQYTASNGTLFVLMIVSPDQEFRWDLQEISVNVPGICSFGGDDRHCFWIALLVLLRDVVSPASLRARPQPHSLYSVCLNKRETKLQTDKEIVNIYTYIFQNFSAWAFNVFCNVQLCIWIGLISGCSLM